MLAPATQVNPELEYRGYVVTPEGTLYRVHDSARKAGVFLKLNERDEQLNVVLKSHDGSRNTLTIEHQGRLITLPERESKIVSSGNAAAVMPASMSRQAGMTMSPAVVQSVVVNPTLADEITRLAAIKAEIDRRRDARAQALQQTNQTASGSSQAAQVQPR